MLSHSRTRERVNDCVVLTSATRLTNHFPETHSNVPFRDLYSGAIRNSSVTTAALLGQQSSEIRVFGRDKGAAKRETSSLTLSVLTLLQHRTSASATSPRLPASVANL